jgi:hypothetical protein
MIGSDMTGTILPVTRTAHPITWTLAARAGVDSKTVMKANRPVATAATDLPLAPPILAVWLSVFRPCFTAPVWNHVLVLVAGAVLAPGKRTVTQALRVMGLGDEPGFGRYHEVLNRARWDARGLARRLLLHVLDSLLPTGPVVIGIDDTIERRWGARIKARGIYRDPVRSSKGHFVKTSGLRWLSLMVIVPIPWAARRWALPFLTILAPSARWSEAHGKRHKTLTTWARQAILQTKRWLPNRELVIVGDNDCLVRTSGIGDPMKAGQSVADHSAGGIETAQRETRNRLAGEPGHPAQFQPDRLAVFGRLDRRDKRGFARCAASALTAGALTAENRVVDLDPSFQTFAPVTLHHRLLKLVLEHPRRRLAHAEASAEFDRGNPLFALRHVVHRAEPRPQRQFGCSEDRSRGRRGLPTAARTLKQPT